MIQGKATFFFIEHYELVEKGAGLFLLVVMFVYCCSILIKCAPPPVRHVLRAGCIGEMPLLWFMLFAGRGGLSSQLRRDPI